MSQAPDVLQDLANGVVVEKFTYKSNHTLAAIENSEHYAAPDTPVFQYPTVYVIYKEDTKQFVVYVGETNKILDRTKKHLNETATKHKFWKEFDDAQHQSEIFVIGHPHFNKSMVLDLENKLLHHLMAVEKVTTQNSRPNPQGMYYPHKEMEQIFGLVWRKLQAYEAEMFPQLEKVRESAIFKASPFHTLTEEQYKAKQEIQQIIAGAIRDVTVRENKLILVEGHAGSGKTVLLSQLFFDLVLPPKELYVDQDGQERIETADSGMQHRDIYLLVNHAEQLKVYREIARKLNISPEKVVQPTTFINTHTKGMQRDSEKRLICDTPKFDVVIVDEGHLLMTQGNQGYQGRNHLDDLRKLAKVVVLVYDQHQVLRSSQHISDAEYKALESTAYKTINLENQLRMRAGEETQHWLKNLVYKDQVVPPPAHDGNGYEVRIFQDPSELFEAIKAKATGKSSSATEESPVEDALSRTLATYDWKYSQKHKPENGDHWNVEIGDFQKPWNYQRSGSNQKNRNVSWAEDPTTVDEIGSTFTIQGFDLAYAGVIIGKSVTYQDGKLTFVNNGKGKNATGFRPKYYKRDKEDLFEDLVRNELNVLLTRGVKGLYIYAEDPDLRAALSGTTPPLP